MHVVQIFQAGSWQCALSIQPFPTGWECHLPKVRVVRGECQPVLHIDASAPKYLSRLHGQVHQQFHEQVQESMPEHMHGDVILQMYVQVHEQIASKCESMDKSKCMSKCMHKCMKRCSSRWKRCLRKCMCKCMTRYRPLCYAQVPGSQFLESYSKAGSPLACRQWRYS